MKLLIVTQSVDLDDPVLGFFHRWIQEFATSCERIEIICLKEGRYSLPENVLVHSLGKEKRQQSSFVYVWRFLCLAWRLRSKYDAVFVHMNQEYVLVAGWLWKLLRKPVGLWYTHGTVSWRLRLAIPFVARVFTASADSMRVVTNKKRVLGHGIDLALFQILPPPLGAPRFITIGRISRTKQLSLLIDAVSRMNRQETHLTIVGAPVDKDGEEYLIELQAQIAKSGMEKRVEFVGATAKEGVPEHLKRAHVFIHASATGSLDKAPIEALASGIPVATTNPEIAAISSAVFLAEPTVESLTALFDRLIGDRPWEQDTLRSAARRSVEEAYSLQGLVRALLAEFNSFAHRI